MPLDQITIFVMAFCMQSFLGLMACNHKKCFCYGLCQVGPAPDWAGGLNAPGETSPPKLATDGLPLPAAVRDPVKTFCTLKEG